jgi:hypothetical protein
MVLDGGLGDLSLDSRHLNDNEAITAVNVDLRREEGVLRAIKSNLLNSSLSEAILGIHRFLNEFLIHTNGKLYYSSLTAEKRTLSKTIPMSVVNYEGKAYIADGTVFVKTSDGSTYTTPFIEAPSNSGITLAISTGSITAFADAGGGKVTVTSAAHGLSNGVQVVITGTTSYNGTFTISDVSADGTTFNITTTWVADDATGTWEEVGELQSGTHKYVFTYCDSANTALDVLDRGESPPSDSVSITIANDNRKVKIAGMPNSSGYNLCAYRWRLGTGGGYRFAKEMTVAEATYTDNLAYRELGGLIQTTYFETPPICKHLVMFNNNLFLLGVSGWRSVSQTVLDNYIFWSADKRFDGYSSRQLARIGKTDDKVVNGLVLGNDLIIYTRGEVHKITGVNSLSYRKAKTKATTGLGAEYALVDTVTFGHLLLGSDRQLHLFNGFDFINNPILQKVNKLFSKDSDNPYRMNWNAREKCRLSFHNNMARLAYPSAGQIENDKVLNIDFKAYPRLRFTISNYDATAFYSDVPNNVEYMGNNDGEFKEVEGGTTYENPILQTKEYDLKNPHEDKQNDKFYMDYDSHGKDITVTPYIDGTANSTITKNKDGREKTEQPQKLAMPNKGKRISYHITWTDTTEDIAIYDIAPSINKIVTRK